MATAVNIAAQLIAGLEAVISYHFTTPLLAWEALQAPGANAGPLALPTGLEGNKRLAILGDTILQLVLVEEWYRSGASKGMSVPLSKGEADIWWLSRTCCCYSARGG